MTAARRPASRLRRASISTFRRLAWLFARVVFRLRIENRPRLRGPFVVVANHASFADPILLGSALGSNPTFLMTMLHFRSAWLGWFYRWMRCIPLALRGSNKDAMRIAREALSRGEILALFPEGGISRDGAMVTGSPGAVSLVLGEDVPIVAAHIEGAHRAVPVGGWPRPTKVVVRFADPIRLDELVADIDPKDRRARLRVATARLMERIAKAGGVTSREADLGWLAPPPPPLAVSSP
ncbi:MAG: lysophospholipid acyltransferase family protein [Planctomycetota bacterium]